MIFVLSLHGLDDDACALFGAYPAPRKNPSKNTPILSGPSFAPTSARSRFTVLTSYSRARLNPLHSLTGPERSCLFSIDLEKYEAGRTSILQLKILCLLHMALLAVCIFLSWCSLAPDFPKYTVGGINEQNASTKNHELMGVLLFTASRAVKSTAKPPCTTG